MAAVINTSPLDAGCRRFIIGIGGSATNDVGTGILRALGVRFLDKQGRATQHMLDFASIDDRQLDRRMLESELIVPCDVDNPLTGEKGAAHVFGPQKGADEEQVSQLAQAHFHFANLIQEQFGIRLHEMPHTGAAGGTSAGLFAILKAQLVKGSAFILDELNFNESLQKADLVITGEGKIDEQTDGGKAPYEVAMRAQSLGKPIIALGGAVPLSLDTAIYDAAFSICNQPMSLEQAMQDAQKLLHAQASQIAQLLKVGRGLVS